MEWHPATVHFPIALLITAAVFYLLAQVREPEWMGRIGWWLHLAGLAGLVLAMLTGRGAEGHLVDMSAELEERLSTHELMGYASIWVFALLAIWRYLRQGRGSNLERWLFWFLFALGIGVMAYGAWLGGIMVYRHGAGVQLPS